MRSRLAKGLCSWSAELGRVILGEFQYWIFIYQLLFIKIMNWDFYIDTGGTFTDCIAVSPDKSEVRMKVLSRGSLSAKVTKIVSPQEWDLNLETDWPENFPVGFKIVLPGKYKSELTVKKWDNKLKKLYVDGDSILDGIDGNTIELFSGWEAPLLAVRLVLAKYSTGAEDNLIRIRLATTKCTNALLEETSQFPALFITEGFGDLLEIGDQRRSGLFDLIPSKRKSFASDCVEVMERTNREGIIEQEPVFTDFRERSKELLRKGHKVAVVSFLNSYLNNKNEKRVALELKKLGFAKVVESASVHPFENLLSRCESAVLEGYLQPVLHDYLENLSDGLKGCGELLIMNSSGGLVNRKNYRAIDSMLSGPAAGVVGASSIARGAGFDRIINLDMGGTSTDVSRFSGKFSYQTNFRVGEAIISNLALDIETVAAGGGSICRFEEDRLLVGPESAGAYPGPACYGFGGPLCLTDVNLLLGRLEPRYFPTPISLSPAKDKLKELVKLSGLSEHELLSGFIAVANNSMATAIRKISVEQGYDPSDHVLLSFGGAGGQHVCGLAEMLGVKKIFSPGDAGLLSAYGLSKSRIEKVEEIQLSCKLSDCDLIKFENQLTKKALDKFLKNSRAAVIRKTVVVRMKGQKNGLEIDYNSHGQIKSLYQARFENIFGYPVPSDELEIYLLRIHVANPNPESVIESFEKGKSVDLVSSQTLVRNELNPGNTIMGPALIVDDFGTLWIKDGWIGKVGAKGSILAEKGAEKINVVQKSVIQRELFKSRFLCMVEEMGAQLKRTSLSVNIRERLDFSCALLDKNGFLIVNAPHIPVHLGALGLCVRESLNQLDELSPGDIVITNHPGFGGSHLPDITLFAPVFSDKGKLVAYLANRAHHAEIGGVLPGSMPSGTSDLKEEGVVILPQFLFKKGNSRFSEISQILTSGPFPTRQLKENIADLSAQVASLRKGLIEMNELFEESAVEVVEEQMKYLFENSSKSCKDFLRNFRSGIFQSTQYFDDGDKLKLKLHITEEFAEFDFAGSSDFRNDNLNATEAIVRSCVCYCLRLLIGKNLPLNEGLLEPIRLKIPSGSVLSPIFPNDFDHRNNIGGPCVAGGNVEVSQKLVDLILCAFGALANSQGTMNNVTFGNTSFSHYETIGGGSGALVGSSGTSAIQVHMTNTSITDPEILESCFPVRLKRFQVRRNSGGEGRWLGGDGIEREYLFEETMHVSLLTQRRNYPAEGIAGGLSGQKGEQVIIRKNGEFEFLDSVVSVLVYEGDRLIIRTPGGGGAGERN